MQESWIDSVKAKLNDTELGRDVSEAEDLLKKHKDLYDEMRANKHKYVFILISFNSMTSMLCKGDHVRYWKIHTPEHSLFIDPLILVWFPLWNGNKNACVQIFSCLRLHLLFT